MKKKNKKLLDLPTAPDLNFFLDIFENFNKISLVAFYGTGIRSSRFEKCSTKKPFLRLKKILSVLFASFIFLIEEFQDVFRFYKDSKSIQSLRAKYDRYKDLSLEEKNEVQFFYNSKIRSLDKSQKLISRESSIQVVLQLTLVSYQAYFRNIEKSMALIITGIEKSG